MALYYHNKNPQVTALLEKIEEQEKKLKTIKEKIEFQNGKIINWRLQLQEFNSLPWYRKVFYKFKL